MDGLSIWIREIASWPKPCWSGLSTHALLENWWSGWMLTCPGLNCVLREQPGWILWVGACLLPWGLLSSLPDKALPSQREQRTHLVLSRALLGLHFPEKVEPLINALQSSQVIRAGSLYSTVFGNVPPRRAESQLGHSMGLKVILLFWAVSQGCYSLPRWAGTQQRVEMWLSAFLYRSCLEKNCRKRKSHLQGLTDY